MEELEGYSFYLYPRHIETLDRVDPNHSKALRTILDSKNRYAKRKQKNQLFDRLFLIIVLGLMFFMFSLLAPLYETPIQLVGILIISYGFFRGVMDAIQLRK